MADQEGSAPSDEPQITFTVKGSNDAKYTITMSPAKTVADLKATLSSSEHADVPPERQRLIYSGRVLKDGDTLASAKLKDGNTIHLVKSAASNVRQNPASASSSGSTPAPAANVPTNIAAGTGNNPLAGLTGARYAGFHGLPNAATFGADGGMGPPPNLEDFEAMLSNPMFLSQMNEMMNNPAFMEAMEQNPMLRDNPVARQLFRDPNYRRLLLDPNIIRAQLRAQRSLGRMGGGAFPAPGATNTSEDSGSGNTEGAQTEQGAATADALGSLLGAGAGTGNSNPFAALLGAPPAGTGASSPGQNRSASPPSATNQNPATAANPFGNLFGNMPPPDDFRNLLQAFGGLQPPTAGSGGTPESTTTGAANPLGNPESMAAFTRLMSNPDFLQAFGGGAGAGFGGMGAAPPQPPDNRPPEERYAEQLRQLNDMGFFDFERNVAALRRSGGSVQGAVEHLLGGGS